MIELAGNKELDSVLTKIFTHSDTLCIGFSFGSDFSVFEEYLPTMNFYKRFKYFIDVQKYFDKVDKV